MWDNDTGKIFLFEYMLALKLMLFLGLKGSKELSNLQIAKTSNRSKTFSAISKAALQSNSAPSTLSGRGRAGVLSMGGSALRCCKWCYKFYG